MSVRNGQARLRKISKHIANGSALSEEDREFLSSALMEIASGRDAETALDVKAKKGERKSEHVRQRKIQLKYFMPWIASAIEPEEEGGFGYTVKEAISVAKRHFPNFPSEETLRRYWADYQRTGTAIFTLERDLNGDLSP